MYAWLWRRLPGPRWVKAVTASALLVAVVLLLFTVVFPWLSPRLPFNDVTVDGSSSSAGSRGAPAAAGSPAAAASAAPAPSA